MTPETAYVAIWLCLGPAPCEYGEEIELAAYPSQVLCEEYLSGHNLEHINATGKCVHPQEILDSGISWDWNLTNPNRRGPR